MADSADRGGGRHAVDILGSRLDLLTRDEARTWLMGALRDPWDGRCRHIVTLNPEYVMSARKNRSFADAIDRADLATADGIGVVLAARLLYRSSVTRLTGVELVEWLAEMSGKANAPLYLLGARPGVAEEAASRLRQGLPDMRIAGTWAGGSAGAEDDKASLTRICETGARIVAVAYGAPGQVLWIDRNRRALEECGVRIAIGAGGSLDYLSESVLRPPALIRRLGLEWLVRLVREPRRWRRQLVLPVFALRVMFEALRRRSRAIDQQSQR